MRKAEVDSLKVIVGAILVLVVAGIMLFIFRSSIFQEHNTIKNALCNTDDYDQDGIPDIVDTCICNSKDRTDCESVCSTADGRKQTIDEKNRQCSKESKKT